MERRHERRAAAWLPDGRRLHLQHGPIDLILEAWGPADESRAAYAQAAARFATILDELVPELPMLRPPDPAEPCTGPVARRLPRLRPSRRVHHADGGRRRRRRRRDPGAMTAGAPLDRAYVNDGGDIALHLAPGALRDRRRRSTARAAAMRRSIDRPADPVRGIATSAGAAAASPSASPTRSPCSPATAPRPTPPPP